MTDKDGVLVVFQGLCARAHAHALAKGFYDGASPPTFGDRIALIHSELSEALEEYRHGNPLDETHFVNMDDKPCGIPSELADAVIRICDLCGAEGIDLGAAILEKMAYNATRPHRHGGKLL